MANIKTYLNNIKTAVFGSEVRDSIHDAIQQCYDDASAKDNANMEVKMARGEYENLGKRLDSHSSQIKDKVNQSDLEVERRRIDSFTKLSEGSTTGDAELIDGRIGDNGITYTNIGGAIRNQVKDLKDDVMHKYNELIIEADSITKDYNVVKSLKNSTFDETTNTVTIPKNTNCGGTYLGYRFIVNKNEIGKTFKVKLSFTASDILISNKYISPKVYFNYQDVTSESYVDGYFDIDNRAYNFIITIPNMDGNKNLDVCLFYNYSGTISYEQTISIDGMEISYYGNTQRLQMYLSKDTSYYYGKQLACFGDSYTAQGKWQPHVVSNLKLNGFDAFAQSGGTLTSIYPQISNLNTNADIVTVWIGTNDYNGNRKIGSLLDDVNDDSIKDAWGYTTFKAGLNYICKWLSTNMKGKNIVFITPTYRHDADDDTRESNNGKNSKGYIINNAGHSLEEYAEAMIEVANHWGFPVLDLFHTSGINELTYSRYYQDDRLHPSEEGAVLLAKKISSFIDKQ